MASSKGGKLFAPSKRKPAAGGDGVGARDGGGGNAPAAKAVAVGEFVLAARGVVEDSFAPLWLVGEVANFTRAASGHWYFVLRDENGQADCVMMARQNALTGVVPAEGDAVEVFAQPTIYPPRGRFQLSVRFLRPTGEGRLHQLFMERKREWTARGWFDSSRKKKLPFLPMHVGVVGSEAGAAVRDVFAVLAKRLPSARATLYNAPAQGADAAEKIAAVLDMANKRAQVDVLILCRGGGGIEDLWAFNEEAVVSAIVRSEIPIVTGIGHEVDETLADFAADARAATPTAAAALAVPDGAELSRRIEGLARLMKLSVERLIADNAQSADICARRLAQALSAKIEDGGAMILREKNLRAAALRRLEFAEGSLRAIRLRRPNIAQYADKLQSQSAALIMSASAAIKNKEEKSALLGASLSALNPQRTLSRGYSITTNAEGKAITDSQNVRAGDMLKIQFAKGTAKAEVKE